MEGLIPAMNGLDIGIIILMSISVLMGIIRGFVREAMSLVTWITAIVLGVVYCEPVGAYFSRVTMSGLRLLLAFILIVLATLIIGGIASYFVGRLIKFTGFGVTDRMIGTLFGFARGAVVIAIAVLIVSATPFTKDKLWTDSNLVHHFEPISVWMKGHIPENLDEKLKFLTEKEGLKDVF